MTWFGALFVLALAVVGCGGAENPSEGTAYAAHRDDHAGGEAKASRTEPIELHLILSDRQRLSLSELRGKPTLVFLLATFDGVSQAALKPASHFARRHPEAHVIGVAAQPNPALLVDAWVTALDPAFPVGYTRDESVPRGTSELGPIEGVPTFIMLDREGRVVESHAGFAGVNKLERMLYRASQ